MSKILKLLQISVVSSVIIFCSFSANASDNIPKLKIKSDKQKVQLEERSTKNQKGLRYTKNAFNSRVFF